MQWNRVGWDGRSRESGVRSRESGVRSREIVLRIKFQYDKALQDDRVVFTFYF